MKKWNVSVSETIEYQFEIEAEDAEDAASQARSKFLGLDSSSLEGYSCGVADRGWTAEPANINEAGAAGAGNRRLLSRSFDDSELAEIAEASPVVTG